MIRHHPSDTIMLTAAVGTLAESHRRVLAVHLARCITCTARLREMQEVGGALLDELAPSTLAPDALTRALAHLDGSAATTPVAVQPAQVTLQTLASGRWRWSGPGIALMPLLKRDESDSRLDLIRVAPGVALPEHGHTHFETTVVLQGSFEDGHDRYEVGDFAEMDADIDHRPRALQSENCVCLIATTGHLSARGWLGRLVRPLIGM